MCLVVVALVFICIVCFKPSSASRQYNKSEPWFFFFFFFQRKETMAAMLDALKSYVRTPSTQNQAEDTVLLHVTHSNLKQHFIEIRFDLHVSNFCKYTSVSSKVSVSRTKNRFLSLPFFSPPSLRSESLQCLKFHGLVIILTWSSSRANM